MCRRSHAAALQGVDRGPCGAGWPRARYMPLRPGCIERSPTQWPWRGRMDTSTAGGTAARPTLGGVVPILRVRDLAESVAYYVDTLGFTHDWTDGTVASVHRDRASAMLCEGDQGRPGTWLWIGVSDVDALYAELGQRGARLRHPPTNYPWGSRECQVSDPDGHVLRFGADVVPGEASGAFRDGEGRLWLPEPDGGWRPAE